jgi:hypothetical protein
MAIKIWQKSAGMADSTHMMVPFMWFIHTAQPCHLRVSNISVVDAEILSYGTFKYNMA